MIHNRLPLNELDTRADRYIKEIGTVTLCMMMRPAYRKLRIANIDLWTRHAIQQRQIDYFFSEKDDPLGYYCWAFMTPEVARSYLVDKQYVLHASEWNEGDQLWITDLCAAPDVLPVILQRIKDKFAATADTLHWEARKRPQGTAARYSLRTGKIEYFTG